MALPRQLKATGAGKAVATPPWSVFGDLGRGVVSFVSHLAIHDLSWKMVTSGPDLIQQTPFDSEVDHSLGC